jgi:site-specific recombinase XerD
VGSGPARSLDLLEGWIVDDLIVVVAGKRRDDLVFTTPLGGVLRSNNFRRDVFDAAAKAADLEGLTPHELRHTAASLAVSAGANVKAVQRMWAIGRRR